MTMTKRATNRKTSGSRRNLGFVDAPGVFGVLQAGAKKLAAIGKKKPQKRNPGGRFQKCVESAAASGARSPRGVCAAAGRKKYGAKKFQQMAAAGRRKKNPDRTNANQRSGRRAVAGRRSTKRANTARLQRSLQKVAIHFRRLKNSGTRRNPEDSAIERYEFFHGRPPDEVVEVETDRFYHSNLSGIGKLVSLKIFAIDGTREVTLDRFGACYLSQDEKGLQLYIRGGDQKVSLADFGITRPHELEILGALLSVVYFTRKDHLTPETGGTANYDHAFGSKPEEFVFGRHGSRLPLVGYDVRNQLLSIQGGGYELPDVGIRG